MLNILNVFKNKHIGFADKLNFAHLVDDGVILNKDGAFVMSFTLSGGDFFSMEKSELDAISSAFNRMMLLFDDGWMIHLDEIRIPVMNYPSDGHFPDDVSRLIDQERRELYESVGKHFENTKVMTLVWKFPLPVVKTMRHWFIEGEPTQSEQHNLSSLLDSFREKIEHALNVMSLYFKLNKMNSIDLLAYLNVCITGEIQAVAVPPDGCFLDVALSRRDVVGGFYPQVGKKYVYALSVIGYLNDETSAGLLDELMTYPMVYRWSNRFIPLSKETAEVEIKKYQKNWNNKVVGFGGIIREVVTGKPTSKIDLDAQAMSHDCDDALTMNSDQSTRFGYWTSTIVLMDESLDVLEDASSSVTRYLEQSGFTCVRERMNALDAWMGTIPGHGSSNARKVFTHAMTLAHALPLHTVWSGSDESPVDSKLPKGSPPLFYGNSTGKIPFRYQIDVSDVGNTSVVGPIGSGKSILLGFKAAQFLRYEHAQIYIFDKDYSHAALTHALGGKHYDIGHSNDVVFSPLSNLSSAEKKTEANQFIEMLVSLQNVELTPRVRSAIHDAIELLSKRGHDSNITVLSSMIQDESVREALRYYTIDGQIKFLDADRSSISKSHLHTFEMNWLLAQKPAVYLPVLHHIFDEIEQRLYERKGEHPTLIILEEAWLYIGHEVFAKKIQNWFKTFRKQNARIVFATQSLSDLYDPQTKNLTQVTASILEGCPTRIYLPNLSMESEIETLYRKMGLSDRQIDIISKYSTPKKDYYITRPEGCRLINLGFESGHDMALSFIALSQTDRQDLIQYQNKYNDRWVFEWLKRCGWDKWAAYWESNMKKGHPA